ncbi:hypothetical protein MTR_8g468280 [Medicago truncatula]|uniref:Uncharacterized protein n=1 Tax=Medicago truncatula TaxID=3880 RepID=A0A072TQJ9_MEDTR|nr:hypothetical protein MTR_8g468280 [Medicago truncatula]
MICTYRHIYACGTKSPQGRHPYPDLKRSLPGQSPIMNKTSYPDLKRSLPGRSPKTRHQKISARPEPNNE